MCRSPRISSVKSRTHAVLSLMILKCQKKTSVEYSEGCAIPRVLRSGSILRSEAAGALGLLANGHRGALWLQGVRCVPLVMGAEDARGAADAIAGPAFQAHALYEKRCEVLHTSALEACPIKALVNSATWRRERPSLSITACRHAGTLRGVSHGSRGMSGFRPCRPSIVCLLPCAKLGTAGAKVRQCHSLCTPPVAIPSWRARKSDSAALV